MQYNADTNHRCNRGWTALHEAVSRNDLEIIDILVKGGAKIESANAYGITSLFVAAESGQLEALRYLARCGEYGLHAPIHLILNNSEFPSNSQFFCLWGQGLACRGTKTLLLLMVELGRVFYRAQNTWSGHMCFFSTHSWLPAMGNNVVLSDCIS